MFTLRLRQQFSNDFIIRVRNPFSSLLVTILINGTNFLLLVIIGRYQGDEVLGKFAFVMGVITILTYITDFGSSYLIQRNVAQNPDRRSEYFVQVLIIRTALTVICFVVPLYFIWLGKHDLTVYYSLIIANIALLFGGVVQIIAAIFTALERIERHLFLRFIIISIQIPLTLILVLNNSNLATIFAIFLLAQVISAITGTWLFRRDLYWRGVSITKSSLMFLIKQALPFAVLFGFYPIFYRLNFIILSILVGDVAVGWYSKAFSIREIIIVFGIAYETAVFPSLAKSVTDRNAFRSRIFQLAWRFMLLAIPFMAILLFEGDTILHLIFGVSSQSQAWTLLKIFTVGIPVFYLSHLLRAVIRASTNQWPQVFLSIALVVTHVLFSLVFIWIWGYIGAGVALVLTDTIGLIFLLMLTQKFWVNVT